MSFELLDFLIEKKSPPFYGLELNRETARFILVGYPFDGTTWQRPGARFGPAAVRMASIGLEEYSLRTRLSIKDLKIHDAGDLQVLHGDPHQTGRRLEEVVREIVDNGKIPVVVGGEHTATLPAVSAISPDQVVVFDAHLDLRFEWPPGVKLSHATVMRRVAERIGVENILFIGSRAYSHEELEYLGRRDVLILDPMLIRADPGRLAAMIEDRLRGAETIYVSVDIDVLEPGIAPGVSDPEPCGLYPHELFNILFKVVDGRLAGYDVVEVSPPNDKGGVTAYYAAKLVSEIAAYAIYKLGR